MRTYASMLLMMIPLCLCIKNCPKKLAKKSSLKKRGEMPIIAKYQVLYPNSTFRDLKQLYLMESFKNLWRIAEESLKKCWRIAEELLKNRWIIAEESLKNRRRIDEELRKNQWRIAEKSLKNPCKTNLRVKVKFIQLWAHFFPDWVLPGKMNGGANMRKICATTYFAALLAYYLAWAGCWWK